jgi:hypothetical protein
MHCFMHKTSFLAIDMWKIPYWSTRVALKFAVINWYFHLGTVTSRPSELWFAEQIKGVIHTAVIYYRMQWVKTYLWRGKVRSVFLQYRDQLGYASYNVHGARVQVPRIVKLFQGEYWAFILRTILNLYSFYIVVVKALCCKPEGRGSSPVEVDFLNWPNSSGRTGPEVDYRNEYQESLKIKKKNLGVKCGRRVGLTTLQPSISRLSK